MTSRHPIIEEVDNPPALPPHRHTHTGEPTQGEAPRVVPMELSLAEAKSSREVIQEPAFVPEGYNFQHVKVPHRARTIMLAYEHRDGGSLGVFQGSPIPQRNIMVQRGFLSQILVGGSPAYLVRGAWGATSHQSGERGPVEWIPDVSFTLYVPKDGEMITLIAGPVANWSGEQLGRVAESIRAV